MSDKIATIQTILYKCVFTENANSLITSLTSSQPQPTATYSVTNNLTNCVNSNSSTSITQGGSYSATISANNGYELSSVICTMGGVSQTVTSGVISIASVSGNIVITASATETSGDTPIEPSDDNITFSDSNVKSYLVNFVSSTQTRIDTNNDGEISYEEASSATNFTKAGGSSLFNSVTDIVSFNEFEYFTGITTCQGNMFKGCTALTSIKMPNSVITMSGNVFNGCSSLTSVTLSNKLTTLGASEFYTCAALTSIKMPNSVASCGIKAFYGCSELTSVQLSNNMTSIADSMFENCAKLTNLTNYNSIKAIGNAAFRGCTNLALNSLPENLETIGARAFYNCKSLAFDTIPSSVTSIGDNSFGSSNLSKIKILSTTPPTITSAALSWFSYIYVPDGSYESYQVAEVWSDLYNSGKLKKISEYSI